MEPWYCAFLAHFFVGGGAPLRANSLAAWQPGHLCLLHFPDSLHSDLTSVSISVPVTLRVRLVTTSAIQPPFHPSPPPVPMPLPQGVAAIVLPNKVYGITGL